MAQFEAWAHLEVRYANFVELEAAGALWYPPIFLLLFFFSFTLYQKRAGVLSSAIMLFIVFALFFFLSVYQKAGYKVFKPSQEVPTRPRFFLFYLVFLSFLLNSKDKTGGRGRAGLDE